MGVEFTRFRPLAADAERAPRLARLVPQALPDLLNGLGAAYKQRPIWSPRQHRALNQARTLLAPYQNHIAWFRALDKYATLAPELRTFTLNGDLRSDISGYMPRERLLLFSKALA